MDRKQGAEKVEVAVSDNTLFYSFSANPAIHLGFDNLENGTLYHSFTFSDRWNKTNIPKKQSKVLVLCRSNCTLKYDFHSTAAVLGTNTITSNRREFLDNYYKPCFFDVSNSVYHAKRVKQME